MTLIESDTRLRAARAIAKSETQAAIEAFERLKSRGHPHSPPPLVSDGWGGYDEAMVEVWGKVPEYGGRGRPPTKKRPQSGWRHLQMVKRRENGRVMGAKAKTIYGDEHEVIELLGTSTSYVERTNLTSRHMNGRLARKTLGYSKELEMLVASSIWEDAVYNLGRALKTLRIKSPEEAGRRWRRRSPAMAAGLTDHIWEIEELLITLPLPITNT
ncbi:MULTISPECIES: IS1 family transposase [Rubrobacter]|uniref:Uncharacterized protein n=1 Tax=Rubrobacter xylanophilus TaxID=49319 RepID=A0A510HIE7_9ACTN|nr:MULTISPECIES: IS1 family transposase [Rubrobacter]BBL79055.1 hypothetical protein RxyAA322_09090 [Rubrobacter xylanophilus]